MKSATIRPSDEKQVSTKPPPPLLRASFFLIAEYALDSETGDAATEAQILQRNESWDIHMPRGALEGPKNQNPRPFTQTARARRTGYLAS